MVYQRIGGQVKDIYTFYSVTIVLDADETISVDGTRAKSGSFRRSFGKRYGVTPLQYRKSSK